MIDQVPGVYQEWFFRGDPPQLCLNFEAVIVTAYLPQMRVEEGLARGGVTRGGVTDVIGCAWRKGSDSEWEVSQGFFNSSDLRPHPDADRVWADYCATMLTR